MEKTLHLLGYACANAGAAPGSSDGPYFLKNSALLSELNTPKTSYQWDLIIDGDSFTQATNEEVVAAQCQVLAEKVSALVRNKQFFTVIGGDHSSAIGTWSGVYDAIHQQGALGLIWIDAHMDSHTPETTESGHIHGMPVASLLGYGFPRLTSILNSNPKIKPENLCLLGVRSFEQGEAALLQRLNVRVFYMEEIQRRGIKAVFQEALDIATKGTVGFGLSLDLDGIDPSEAPAVDVPEPNGIHAEEICEAFAMAVNNPHCLGAEIAEFDPAHDENKKTEKWMMRFLSILMTKASSDKENKACYL